MFFFGTSFIISCEKAHVALRIADDSSSVPGFFRRETTCVYFVGSGALCWKLETPVTLPGELRQLLTQVRLDDPGHLQVGHDFVVKEISTHAEPVVILICQYINMINIHVSIKANTILKKEKKELIQTCQIQSFDTV